MMREIRTPIMPISMPKPRPGVNPIKAEAASDSDYFASDSYTALVNAAPDHTSSPSARCVIRIAT